MSDNNSGGGFLIGLLVGGIIGGLVGLLLAPKSGAETRAELLKKGEVWRSQADTMAADVWKRGMAQVGEMTQKFGPASESIRERGAATRETVRETGVAAVAAARQRIVPDRSNNQSPAGENDPNNG